MKIPGTWARKAKHTQDRPHRQSKLIYTPTIITSLTIEQLQLVLDHLGTSQTQTKARRRQYTAPPTARTVLDRHRQAPRRPATASHTATQ